MISKPNPELQKELDLLNQEVIEVLKKRRDWMDSHMEDFSNFKVGDKVYGHRTGYQLGVVTELYRYWSKQNPLYDTSMNIEITYREEGSNYYDNSSRHAGAGPWFVTGTEIEQRFKGIFDAAKDT